MRAYGVAGGGVPWRRGQRDRRVLLASGGQVGSPRVGCLELRPGGGREQVPGDGGEQNLFLEKYCKCIH